MAPAIRPFGEKHNKSVAHNTYVSYLREVNAQEFRRWLKKRGCSFETHKGGSGHLTVRRGNRTSQLPMHGSRKELGPKLVKKIKGTSAWSEINARISR